MTHSIRTALAALALLGVLLAGGCGDSPKKDKEKMGEKKMEGDKMKMEGDKMKMEGDKMDKKDK